MTELTQVASKQEVNKEKFLSLLPEQDKTNLENLKTKFEEAGKREELSVRLLVVGGILEKPQPRKDIDVIAVFEPQNFPEQEKFSDYYQYSLAAFGKLEKLTERILAQNSNFSKGEVLRPSIDEEYNSPSILKHDGSIKLLVKKGTPIELIREPKVGLEKVAATITSPFVIL